MIKLKSNSDFFWGECNNHGIDLPADAYIGFYQYNGDGWFTDEYNSVRPKKSVIESALYQGISPQEQGQFYK